MPGFCTLGSSSGGPGVGHPLDPKRIGAAGLVFRSVPSSSVSHFYPLPALQSSRFPPSICCHLLPPFCIPSLDPLLPSPSISLLQPCPRRFPSPYHPVPLHLPSSISLPYLVLHGIWLPSSSLPSPTTPRAPPIHVCCPPGSG